MAFLFLFPQSSFFFFFSFSMPSKGGCCGDREVVVNVYVEKPRRRSDHSNPSRRQQQNHVIRRRLIHGRNINGGGGYDRRALLLHYSQQLRETARSQLSPASITPSHHSPSPSFNSSQHAPLVPQRNTSQQKKKNSRTPGCMGDCMSLLPKFLISSAGAEKKEKSSRSTMSKIVATAKNFKVKEKWGSLMKFFPIRRKRSS